MLRLPRYPSDLTGTQWALIEPLVPVPSAAGRRPKHRRRDLGDVMVYVARTGWALPADFLPYRCFALACSWRRGGGPRCGAQPGAGRRGASG